MSSNGRKTQPHGHEPNELEATTEAEAISKQIRDLAKPRKIKVGDHPLLVLPRGQVAHSVKQFVDEYRTAPERRTGVAQLGDLASFINHANRFKDSSSAIFVDRTTPSMTCVLDYHHPSPKLHKTADALAEDDGARFGTHRGVYNFPLSEEWKAWNEVSGKQLGQRSFAEFIEDHLTDVADPAEAGPAAHALSDRLGLKYASPGMLLMLSKGLSLHVNHRVANATNLATGEINVSFQTEHSGSVGEKLLVPSAFLVAIPVFQRGSLFVIAVRLRYRVNDGEIKWTFALHDARRNLDHAIDEACDEAGDKTLLPLFTGKPE